MPPPAQDCPHSISRMALEGVWRPAPRGMGTPSPSECGLRLRGLVSVWQWPTPTRAGVHEDEATGLHSGLEGLW